MSNNHFREKIRKITKSVENHHHIPEPSKRLGLTIFLIFCATGILALLAVAFFLFFYRKVIPGLVMLGMTAFAGYFMYKVFTADEIPDD